MVPHHVGVVHLFLLLDLPFETSAVHPADLSADRGPDRAVGGGTLERPRPGAPAVRPASVWLSLRAAGCGTGVRGFETRPDPTAGTGGRDPSLCVSHRR